MGYMSEADRSPPAKSRSAGCAIAMLAINGLLMGLATLSFFQGPYSSLEQELWYRYGSIIFTLAGAVIPAIILLSVAKRPPWLVAALTIWMVAVLGVFVGYALISGGGV